MTTPKTATGGCCPPPPCSALDGEQLEILKHANRPESRGQFVGESPEMNGLVELGLMKDIGKPSWCPDTFYEITEAGRDYLPNAKGEVSK